MRPRMTIDEASVGVMDVEEPEMGEPTVAIEENSQVLQAMDEAIRREQAQAGLNELIDKVERKFVFMDSKSNAVMCVECARPCYTNSTSTLLRGIPLGNGTVICAECLCGG